MQNQGLLIEVVDANSVAGEVGLEPGDLLLQVNGAVIQDILDYQFAITEESLEILVQKKSGEQWLLDIEKDFDEPMGITFREGGWGRTRNCANKCVFCFVDQMPADMRQTLYIKDDDYRLSFAQGNFITLTNTGAADLERIVQMRLSPLYISVHATNPELRRKLMGNHRAGDILSQLQFLARAGIEMHAQAVLCPGLNDGAELDRTAADLGGLWPAVRSLAVVPVGLTGHRRDLHHLQTYTRQQARQVLEQVHRWQDVFQTKYTYPFIFAGDEFYLLSGTPIPEAAMYGGFPQTENGVGLVRLFWDEWEKMRPGLPRQLSRQRSCSLVTGSLGAPVLTPVVEELNQIVGVKVQLYVLTNRFFGETVTVAGLLTGQDVLEGLSGKELGDLLVLPSVMLRQGEQILLDDLTLDQLSARLGVPVAVADGPAELFNLILR